MGQELISGAGNKIPAFVNNNGRLLSSAIVTSENLQATKLGDSYNINTKYITLTDAAQTPLLYIKNNETQDLHIVTIVIGTRKATSGDDTGFDILIERNPTAGTIVSSPVAVSINSNRNYGSAKTLTVDAYAGATGKTMTGGTEHVFVYQSANGRVAIPIDEVLPKGSSIGVSFTSETGNSSQKVYVAVICHLEDIKEGTN